MSSGDAENGKQGNTSPSRRPPDKGPRRKHWYETAAVAIVLIIAVAGGYYGFYVTNRSARLSDYYSRNLASAASIVEQVIQGAWLNVCNTEFRKKRLAMVYGISVVPGTWEEAEQQDNETPTAEDVSQCAKLPNLETVAGWYQGAATLQFSNDRNAARMPLLPLLESALPASEFDTVLLARKTGEVLFSVGSEELNIVTLPTDGLSVGAEVGEKGASGDASPRGQYTSVTNFDVSGTTYKLFVQPFRVPIDLRWQGRVGPGTAANSMVQDEAEDVWLLVGLKKNGRFMTEAMAISPTVLLVAFGVAIIALLSMPYLKLRYLGRREALHMHDVLVLTSALLIGTTIATFAVLETYARLNLDDATDRRLNAVSSDISTAFHEEVACLNDQLQRLTDLRADNNKPSRVALAGPAENVGLTAYPFLEMAYWMNRDGLQTNKWTVKGSTTTLIPVGSRKYFIAARDMRFEAPSKVACPRAKELGNPDPNGYTLTGYYLESIRSRTTGEVSTVLSERLVGGAAGFPDKAVIRTATGEPVVAAAALAPLLSVTEPTLPPGFSFAVIDRDGEVVLHSNSTRNLRENFFDELTDGLQVQAAVWSRTTAPVGPEPALQQAAYPLQPMNVEYRARAYRANLTRLDGTAWTLVSLYDISSYRIARAEVLTFALALSLIYTILLMALFAVLHLVRVGLGNSRDSMFHWLWPAADKRDAYVGMLVFAIAASLAWLLLQILVSPAVSVLLSGLLGLVTFYTCFETFRKAAVRTDDHGLLAAVGKQVSSLAGKQASSLPAMGRAVSSRTAEGNPDGAALEAQYRLYALTVMAIIIVLSVLPPIAFYRASNNEIMELFTMGDQLRLADEFRARSDRKAQRYRYVNMSAEVSTAIREHLFPASGDLGESWDTHTAGWKVCVGWKCAAKWFSADGENRDHGPRELDRQSKNCADLDEMDRCLSQPIVAMLGPNLLGIVRQSWEIRTLAHDANRRWHRHGGEIVFVDRTFDSTPPLGKEDSHSRLAEPLHDWGLYLASPWPGLAFPGANLARWVWLVLLAAAGAVALWVMIRGTARLVFLTDLRQPMFLPIRKWRDLDGCQRALVLRTSLRGEPSADGKSVFRIDAVRDPDVTDIDELEKEPGTAASAVVIVDRFHIGLWEPAVAETKLVLLERLLRLDCRVVVHSDVNPLHYFTMVAGDYFRGATPALPDLGRWAAALAEFPRCRNVLLDGSESEDLYRRLVARREETCGVGDAERIALRRIAVECWPSRQLEDIAMRLACSRDLKNLLAGDDDETLVKQILDLAEAHYRVLWSISGKDERMVLYRLARNGFASWRGRELVRRLLNRGLIYLDPGPKLVNESFRQFILTAELPEVLEAWTAEEGASPWARLRTPIMLTVVGIFLFLFATQPQLFSQSLAFTTAIAAIVPTFIKVVSLVAGTRSDGAG